jgi:S1-C subfamily serine protease
MLKILKLIEKQYLFILINIIREMARKKVNNSENTQYHHRSHRMHRNVLYGMVIFVLIVQGIYFFLLDLHVQELQNYVDTNIEKVEKKQEDLGSLIENKDTVYRTEFDKLNNAVEDQKSQHTNLRAEFDLIKISTGDFTKVIEESIEGVVGIGTRASIGTGFIVTDDGLIVTNYHVIDDGGPISVLKFDRTTVPARIIGTDPIRDLALLKITGVGYKELKLGKSDELSVGNKVIAIGNPLGLSFSVTEGIISALNREGANNLREYIQTDVPLNPGNSGGPLININGKVVGINNFKVGGSEGLGFALESNSIRETINKIVNNTILD